MHAARGACTRRAGTATEREARTRAPVMRHLRLTLLVLLVLLLHRETDANRKSPRSGRKNQPPEGLSGGPGGRGRGASVDTDEPYVDPKTVPDPEPDPTAFLVDFEVEGTVDGVRRRPMGTFTLKVSPNWAPIGVERMRLVLHSCFHTPGPFLCQLAAPCKQAQLSN